MKILLYLLLKPHLIHILTSLLETIIEFLNTFMRVSLLLLEEIHNLSSDVDLIQI